MLTLRNYSLKIEDNLLFENVNITFDNGIYLFLGPNGVGKTTLSKKLADITGLPLIPEFAKELLQVTKFEWDKEDVYGISNFFMRPS